MYIISKFRLVVMTGCIIIHGDWFDGFPNASCLRGKNCAFGCFFYMKKCKKHIRLVVVEWYERSSFRNTWLPGCWVVVLLRFLLPCPWSLVPNTKWIVFDEPINYAEACHDPGRSTFPYLFFLILLFRFRSIPKVNPSDLIISWLISDDSQEVQNHLSKISTCILQESLSMSYNSWKGMNENMSHCNILQTWNIRKKSPSSFIIGS